MTTNALDFLALNRAGRLLLPNAWDAASARIFEDAGFPAIGTTSAGIAHSRGIRDGERIGRDAMVREIASIVRAVACPVTADIEAGYGPTPADVVRTIGAVLDVGVVGVNLEDNAHGAGDAPLSGVADQCAKIAAARDTAERHGVSLVINARTDTFLLGLGASIEERVAMTVERGRAYRQAGADLIFVPVLIDLTVVSTVAAAIGPISVMALPGGPSADALFTAGASRVSIGPAAMLATLAVLRDIAHEMRSAGTWASIERHPFSFSDAEALFARS